MSMSRVSLLLLVCVVVCYLCGVASAGGVRGSEESALQPEASILAQIRARRATAAPAATSTCAARGGACIPKTACAGTVQSGMCPGAANILCCFNNAVRDTTPEFSAAIKPPPSENPPPVANLKQAVLSALTKAGITDAKERAAFMANAAVETGNFEALVEGRYSATRVWQLRGKQLAKFGVTQAMLVKEYKTGGSTAMYEFMYSDKYRVKSSRMGNDQPGDGAKFIGRGVFQLTGKNNYKAFSQRLYGDDRLVRTPEILGQQGPAIESAIAFFKLIPGLRSDANKGLIDRVSATINTGSPTGVAHGLKERRSYYNRYIKDPSITKP